MTIIILNGKKAAVISYGQSISYIDILDNYIKWLIISTEWLRPTQKATFFSVCYNLIISYVQIYHGLTFLWWNDDGQTVNSVS